MTDDIIGKISFGCDKDFAPVFDTFREMKNLMDMARRIVADGLDLLDCERVTSMYEDLIYEGTCTYSVQGFAWSACCLFIVSLMGMIMITLRSSFQNELLLEVDAEEIESKDFSDSNDMLATTLGDEDILESSADDERDAVQLEMEDDSGAFDKSDAIAASGVDSGRGEVFTEDFSVRACETLDVEEGSLAPSDGFRK